MEVKARQVARKGDDLTSCPTLSMQITNHDETQEEYKKMDGTTKYDRMEKILLSAIPTLVPFSSLV